MSAALRVVRYTLQGSTRRKGISFDDLDNTKLKRCLSIAELTFLGIGSTIGSGLYVISGQVAREQAGPSVIISYSIAMIACLLSAVCYAEFTVRLPRSGSSYTYCYATVGELIGFVVGWNVIFENIIGFASVAKAWSRYFDSFTNDTIKRALEEQIVVMDVPGFDTYIDFLAFGLVIAFTVVAAIGVRITSAANFFFTAINIVVIVIVIGVGAFYSKPANWSNFAPFGVSGMLQGSGRCFYAMIGFDIIASSSEETRDRLSIPRAMLLTLFVCFLLYFSTSVVLTLMVPWYELDVNAPLAKAFQLAGVEWAQYMIGIGAICALSASIVGSVFSAARTTYSMAQDGLIFTFLARITKFSNTPIIATATVGFLGGILAMFVDLTSLVEMMSIGTLLAYTLVAASVLVLRYQTWTVGIVAETEQSQLQREAKSYDSIKALDEPPHEMDSFSIPTSVSGFKKLQKRIRSILCPYQLYTVPTDQSARIARIATFTFCCTSTAASVFVVQCGHFITAGSVWAICVLVAFIVVMLLHFAAFCTLPQNPTKLHYKVPMMPLWALISLSLNIFIMITLSPLTWLRVAVWQLLGFIIYFAYGIRHSTEASHDSDDDQEMIIANEERMEPTQAEDQSRAAINTQERKK